MELVMWLHDLHAVLQEYGGGCCHVGAVGIGGIGLGVSSQGTVSVTAVGFGPQTVQTVTVVVIPGGGPFVGVGQLGVSPVQV
ncbi:hypothetical protein H2199_003240 [Coniosporium tulheliwenetii]|uniref:Uncharacterized protein n=1 Tax=Coniosporium tulheliwenetii TaxID=3383036 RepID=A0ACC2ZC26_9PEZI|nr:hypothetical protein H2199_003240 [Cladosporium sp. JES 115]